MVRRTAVRRTGWLLASLAAVAALPMTTPRNAAAQTGTPGKGAPTMELGIKLCGPDPMPDETKAEFNRRQAIERNTPDWIWTALDSMQAGPETMTFTFKQVGNDRVIYAFGEVDDDAAQHLDRALKRYAPISEVWLNSPGGNSQVGIEMGNVLHNAMVGTRVRTGNGCASACSTAFLGGVVRRVEEGGIYGVHMYSTKLDGDQGRLSPEIFNEIQWQGAKGAADRSQYVQRMGISLKWLQIWSGTRPGCMTFMSQDEMAATNVNNLVE